LLSKNDYTLLKYKSKVNFNDKIKYVRVKKKEKKGKVPIIKDRNRTVLNNK
jgi:hypothetical protein